MALSRASALRTSSVNAFVRSARSVRRSPSQQCLRLSQQPARRGYASAAGESVQKTSELPWALAAVVMTVGGSWLALQPRSAPHEAHGHDDHHGEEKESEEEEKSEESSDGGEEPKEDGGEETPKEEASESEEKPKEDAEPESKDEAETPSTDSDEGKSIGKGVSSETDDETSEKQKGVSNTDTKHSTDPQADETKSSKGEGTADTAKVKGTVKTDRPQK